MKKAAYWLQKQFMRQEYLLPLYRPLFATQEDRGKMLWVNVISWVSQEGAAACSGMQEMTKALFRQSQNPSWVDWHPHCTQRMQMMKYCEWRVSVMGQSYSVTRQPGDMNSIHRAQSRSAPSHSTQYTVSLSDSANKHWTQCNKMVEIWAGSQ